MYPGQKQDMGCMNLTFGSQEIPFMKYIEECMGCCFMLLENVYLVIS